MSNATGLIDQYESLLVSNLGAVRSIESGLRNVSWLLPGRFQDAELASEGLYALLNVVSGYHDSLLSKFIDPKLYLPPHPFIPLSQQGHEASDTPISRTAPLLPPPTDHARYTRYWATKSKIYRKASRLLATVGYIQLLVEMIAKKRLGERRRWNFVLSIEAIKTVLRLILLAVTRRPVLTPAAPQREYDLLSLPSTLLRATKNITTPLSDAIEDSDEPAKAATAPGEAITPSLSPFAPLRTHLFPMSTALPESHLAHPLSLLPEVTPAQCLSEIIESSVTLIHVLLLVRSARRRKTSVSRYSLPTLSSPTAPYLIPLLLCLVSRRLRPTDSRSLLLAEHHANLDRRLAARAFLTGPMWIGWTRPKIMRVVKFIERLPLVGMAGDLVEGYIPLVDEYFYYSS